MTENLSLAISSRLNSDIASLNMETRKSFASKKVQNNFFSVSAGFVGDLPDCFAWNSETGCGGSDYYFVVMQSHFFKIIFQLLASFIARGRQYEPDFF